MIFRRFATYFWFCVSVLAVGSCLCSTVHAQALIASASLPEAPTPAVEPVAPVVLAPSIASSEHRFFDKQNRVLDRKSTRLNSSHLGISYAVFCLKKKKK